MSSILFRINRPGQISNIESKHAVSNRVRSLKSSSLNSQYYLKQKKDFYAGLFLVHSICKGCIICIITVIQLRKCGMKWSQKGFEFKSDNSLHFISVL